MDIVNVVTSLISNMGFPIACVCVMFWMQIKEREAHAEESAEWVKALNRNTLVMERIMAKLGVEVDNDV